MRGSDGKSGSFFSYVDLDERIRALAHTDFHRRPAS